MVRFPYRVQQDKVKLLSSSQELNILSNTRRNIKAAVNEAYQQSIDEIDRTESNLAKDEEYETVCAASLASQLIEEVSLVKSLEAKELACLLSGANFKALISAYDEIVRCSREKRKAPSTNNTNTNINSHNRTEKSSRNKMPLDTMKLIALRRNPNQPLGLTVEVDEHKQLAVARILAGGLIDQQGVLQPGDVILEVNGVPVHTPEELQVEVSRAKEQLTLKIGPKNVEEHKSGRLIVNGNGIAKQNGIANLEAGKKMKCFMRALFTYNPNEDTLLPCRDIGLPFRSGDVLQIINVKDPNWWQARNVTTGDDKTGLIPSQELEERRKAFVPPEADYVHKIGICGTRISKRKRKTMYRSVANCEFDKAELIFYEEVTRAPPFRRNTLVLIGVSGVGRRTLKNRLINSDPERFGPVVPHTTRPKRALEENGETYWFTDREQMEEEIRCNDFLEYGEHNGYLYGTHMQSIRDVIKSGRMCVLDCAPSSLKLLHNSQDLMPFVIFIAAPGMEQLKLIYADRRATGSNRNLTFDRQSSIRFSSRRARTLESLASLYEDDDLIATVEESAFLQRKYEKYFDMVIVNDDFDDTFRQVVETLDQMSHEEQWVPVNWIY